jgi:hypothetical protein
MTTIEPWTELGQTKEQFLGCLLGLIEERISAAERTLPCGACTICQFTTCVKAGAYRYRRAIQLEATTR